MLNCISRSSSRTNYKNNTNSSNNSHCYCSTNSINSRTGTNAYTVPDETVTATIVAALQGQIHINFLFSRRVDPSGRTVGEFLREEISVPLGADANIGATEEELKRFKDLTSPSAASVMLGCFTPAAFGGPGKRVEIGPKDILQMVK